MSMEKQICGDCVSDDYLKIIISQSTKAATACEYCEKVKPTIDMWALTEMVNDVIANFYESTNSDENYIWDSEPEGDSLDDVLHQIVGLPDQAVEDLTELLSEMWFDRDTFDHQYGEDPHFVEKTRFEQPLSEAWRRMEQSLKHEARFVNPTVHEVLENVFGPVLDDRTYDDKPVIVEVGPGCEIDHLYRARVFQTEKAMVAALSHPQRHIGPPPEGEGAAGRMNAKGVSVFYGATDKKIALNEVRPPVGSRAVMGNFRITRKLRLLDVKQLGIVVVPPGKSLFAPSTANQIIRSDFLGTLTDRIVMPVMPELEDQSYLITQAIADFLATHPRLNLDGIIFPSAQHVLTLQKIPGRNVILFNKASRVLDADAKYADRTKVNLWDIDEDGARFDPEIWTEVEETPKLSRYLHLLIPEWKVTALELDLKDLEIFDIKSVAYNSVSHGVKHTVQSKKESKVSRREV